MDEFFLQIPALSPFPGCPLGFSLGEVGEGAPLRDKIPAEIAVLLALAARAHEGDLGLPFALPEASRLVAHARSARGPLRPKVRVHPEQAAAEEAEGQLKCFGQEGDPAPPGDRAYRVGFEALCLLAAAEAPVASVRALGRMFSEGFPAYVESANEELGARLAGALGRP